MVKKTVVPDAWEDDWETQADSIPPEEQSQAPEASVSQTQPQTKEERLARHAESNRKIWESAESPETFHFLEANSSVPLTSSFKPQVKVLSRKPMIAKRDPTTGMSRMTLDEGDDQASGNKEPKLTSEEIRAKQRRDHEEKQRRYEEARAKIFGESAPSSGASSPSGATTPSGNATPPRQDGQHTPKGRGRGRGGGGGQRMSSNSDTRQADSRRQNGGGGNRELFEPNYAPRPDSQGSGSRGADGEPSNRIRSSRNEQQAIRAPRGPDGSGRGGFGFTRRGA